MNTTQLECFMSVSNFLNFSRAAEQLCITQPAVSHQINALEDELGVKLFHRSSKSVRLTQAGHLFTQYASEMLRLSGLSKARLKAYQQALPMRFGVGCRDFMELRLFTSVLAQLRQEEPQLLPVLRLIPFASLETQLADGDIQVMFSYQDTAPKRASYRELIRRPIVCVCSADYPLAEHSQLTIPQLKEYGRIAVCTPPSCPPGLFAVQNQLTAGRGPDQMLFCDNLEIIYSMAESGFTFAVMADLPPVRLPGLRYIPLTDCHPLSFGVAYLSEQSSPILRRFFALLEEILQTDTAQV